MKIIALALVLLALPQDPEKHYDQNSRRAAPRDRFPVFNNPDMVNAATAESKGYVRDSDTVIGVAIKGEAKAYPIPIMGVHELGNDTCGGTPICVSW